MSDSVEIRRSVSGWWTVLVHGVEVHSGQNETFASVAFTAAQNTVERMALLDLLGVGPTEYRHYGEDEPS